MHLDSARLGLVPVPPSDLERLQRGQTRRWHVYWTRIHPRRRCYVGEIIAPFHWLAHEEACDVLGLDTQALHELVDRRRAIQVVEQPIERPDTPARSPAVLRIERRDRRIGCLSPWQVARMKALMLRRIDRRVSLAEMAEHLGLAHGSRPYLVRGFKGLVGVTPYQWQKRRRIERAKALLLRTDLPVGVIAGQLGYASSQTFAKVFTGEVGQCPRAFRRAGRSGAGGRFSTESWKLAFWYVENMR